MTNIMMKAFAISAVLCGALAEECALETTNGACMVQRRQTTYRSGASLEEEKTDGVCPNKLWDQCGGTNFIGQQCCATGSTCVISNEWYSQCLSKSDDACPNEHYEQCGGKNFTGQQCCLGGSTCVVSDEWYSQCRPEVKEASSSSSSTSEPPAPKSGAFLEQKTDGDVCPNKLWAQCGGKNFIGQQCCATGSTCVISDEWYSQCLSKSDDTCPNEHYDQCGGKNYTGEQCCPGGSTCVFSGEWYSQCRPEVGEAPSSSSPTSEPPAPTSGAFL